MGEHITVPARSEQVLDAAGGSNHATLDSLSAQICVLEQAQSIAQLGYYDLDIESGYWTSSDILDSIFGIGPSFARDVAGWLSLVHPMDREMMALYLENEVMGLGVPFDKEYRIVRVSDGTTREVHGFGQLERNAAGTATRLVGTIQDISERKQVERDRNETQVRLQLAVQAANIGLWDWDLASGEVYFSTEWKQQLGLADHEINGTIADWESRLHPDDHEAATSVVSHCVEHRDPGLVIEFRLRHHDGSYRWIHSEGALILDRLGAPARLVGCNTDVTDRKKSERSNEIIQHLHRYARSHSLGELLTETLDQMGELLESPAGFYHFVGSDEETIELQAWSTATVAHLCHAADQGAHYPIEEAGVWADCVRARCAVVHNDYASLPTAKGLPEGHALITRELVVPIFRGDRIMAIIGIGNKPHDYTTRDVELVTYIADVAWGIAQHKRTDQVLAAGEERYRLSMELSPDAVFLHRDGLFVFVNTAGVKLLGATGAEDLLGTPVIDRVHPDHVETALARAGTLIEHGSVTPLVELKILCLDGTQIDGEVTTAMIDMPAGPTFETILRDISASKAHEAEILRHQQQLARLTAELLKSGERERHRVAVDLHDGVGQALAVAKLSAQQLVFEVKECVDSEAADQLIEALETAISGVRSLTLELSPPLLHEFGLGAALERLAESFLRRYGFNCEVRYDNEAGRLKNDAASMIHRCATELLNNAQRHSGRRTANLSASLREGVLQLQVEDHGRGFNPEHLNRDELHNDNGFGLSSIQDEVALVGGTTTIDSAPGRGTRVEIRLSSDLNWSDDPTEGAE